jgi:hypothetical protein
MALAIAGIFLPRRNDGKTSSLFSLHQVAQELSTYSAPAQVANCVFLIVLLVSFKHPYLNMVLRDSWRHISVLRIRAVPMIAMPAQILAPLGQYALSLLPINKELA